MNMNDNTHDLQVYSIAQKMAREEYGKYSRFYNGICEPDDLAEDLFHFYLHYTKPHLDKAEDKLGFAVQGLYFGLTSIRKYAREMSKRFVIESDLFDGEFQPSTYFEMLEHNGGFQLWNDKEKVIDRKAIHPKTPDRACVYDKIGSPVGDVEIHEFWDRLESVLSARDFNIACMIAIEGKTEREIARKIGISQQAVHKVIKKLGKVAKDFEEYR